MFLLLNVYCINVSTSTSKKNTAGYTLSSAVDLNLYKVPHLDPKHSG